MLPKNLPWKLITLLGLIELTRPLLKITGQLAGFEITPTTTYILTAITAVIWVAVVVVRKVKKPVHTLAMAGAVYAVASIALAVVIQLFPHMADPQAKIPLLLTVGLVASLLFNVAYGALLGVIAQLITSALGRKR